jgi:hypothetical protein
MGSGKGFMPATLGKNVGMESRELCATTDLKSRAKSLFPGMAPRLTPGSVQFGGRIRRFGKHLRSRKYHNV